MPAGFETHGDARLHMGLNPYGLTYHLGLQGAGTPRANPKGRGLEGFLEIAGGIGAKTVEIFNPWLSALSAAALNRLANDLRGRGVTPVVSTSLDERAFDSALRSAKVLGAATIRMGLTQVLCGDRHVLGGKWPALAAEVRDALAAIGPRAAESGAVVAIENHQDFTSAELVEFCATIPGLGICFDMGNTFPVAEAPLDFTRAIAPHVRHLHLKDYRVQFTDEGYRLVRCAIGDGAVPFAAMLDILLAQNPGLTGVLEPGALEARHVRLLRPEWWNGYAAKPAAALAACLAAARVNKLDENEDWRTPWETGDDAMIAGYELAMIQRSAENMVRQGIMRRKEDAR